MKKRLLVFVFLVFIGFLAFGEAEKQEEIDFLLFLPNSGNLFVNQEQAMVQLDNLARYLRGREFIPGQIYVYGYAAFAENDIEPVNLSRERALFVISELQQRGVPQNLFSDPVAHGSVDLWGSNIEEEDRSPNRRVRVVVDGNVVTRETLMAAEPEITISGMDDEVVIRRESAADESPFPWWMLLLLALLCMLAGFAFRKKTAPEKKADAPITVPAATSGSVKPIAASTVTVNLQEEIRLRAYERYLQRNGQSENAYEDWCRAVIEISAKYEADGYQVYREDEWWARKSTGRKV